MLGWGDIQNQRFIFLGGGKGVERGEIPIFDFLECWGYEGPIRTFGSGGVMKAPLEYWNGGVLSTPLDFWDGGVLSTPLDFWDGGVLSTSLAFWFRVGYFPLNALERLLCLGRQSWCGGFFTSPTPDRTPCLWPGLGVLC